MSLWRWDEDPELARMGWPPAVYIRRRKFRSRRGLRSSRGGMLRAVVARNKPDAAAPARRRLDELSSKTEKTPPRATVGFPNTQVIMAASIAGQRGRVEPRPRPIHFRDPWSRSHSKIDGNAAFRDLADERILRLARDAYDLQGARAFGCDAAAASLHEAGHAVRIRR